MEFLDEVVIYASSGKGGDGAATFRREKYVPRGGPDGGDGGRGGSIVFTATRQRNTLIDYRRFRHQTAEDGRPGGAKQMYGAAGPALQCPVPLGTMISDEETGALLADLEEEGASWEMPGGEGGMGNIHFKSSTNRTPTKATEGAPGQERLLKLELKLIADIGLIGFPNAGKSTFLARVSAARPRVANYPFTTLIPNLGVVKMSDHRSFVVADIPGLIEGAAEGLGLGHRFLKHVERCAGFLHLVSPGEFEEGSLVERFNALNGELRAYDEDLARRPQLIVLNKIDLLSEEERVHEIEMLSEAAGGARVMPISGVTGEGVPELVTVLWQLVKQRSPEPAEAVSTD